MKTIRVSELIQRIEDTGATIEIENRDQGDGWYDYGFPTCHGKAVRYCNPVDNEAWDDEMVPSWSLGTDAPSFRTANAFTPTRFSASYGSKMETINSL